MQGAGQCVVFPLLPSLPKGKKTPLSKTALQPPALIPESLALSCLMDSIPVYPSGMSASTDPEPGERVFVPHARLKKTPIGSDCLPPRIVALLCVFVNVWSCLAEPEAIKCSVAFPHSSLWCGRC